MPSIVVGLPSLTIANNGSTSNGLDLIDDAWGVTIYAPAALTNTCSVEVSNTSSSGSTFVTLQSGGSDVTVPAAKATVLSPVPWKQMRITSAGAEGGARVFTLTKAILT